MLLGFINFTDVKHYVFVEFNDSGLREKTIKVSRVNQTFSAIHATTRHTQSTFPTGSKLYINGEFESWHTHSTGNPDTPYGGWKSKLQNLTYCDDDETYYCSPATFEPNSAKINEIKLGSTVRIRRFLNIELASQSIKT